MKKYIRVFSFIYSFIFVLAVPSIALADEGSEYVIPPDAIVITAPEAPIGSTLVLDLDTYEYTVLAPSSARLSVSRGCVNPDAACWAGSGNPGDMQFAGTGALNGNWPNRNTFSAGNKSADIGFIRNGQHIYVENILPWRDHKLTGTVDGFYVYRY